MTIGTIQNPRDKFWNIRETFGTFGTLTMQDPLFLSRTWTTMLPKLLETTACYRPILDLLFQDMFLFSVA